jgi:hypothetical protein
VYRTKIDAGKLSVDGEIRKVSDFPLGASEGSMTKSRDCLLADDEISTLTWNEESCV